MPLIRLETSVQISEEKKAELISALSKIIAETIGKPESYVMAMVSESKICMAGEIGPAAFADIRSIGGLNQRVNCKLSKEVADLLKQILDIPQDRVYLSFNDVSGVNWGWNGKTFG